MFCFQTPVDTKIPSVKDPIAEEEEEIEEQDQEKDTSLESTEEQKQELTESEKLILSEQESH